MSNDAQTMTWWQRMFVALADAGFSPDDAHDALRAVHPVVKEIVKEARDGRP